MTLGEQIKNSREKKNLSQEELAFQLGVSRQAVSKWENGKAHPDLYNFKLLCNLYNLSADSLLKDDEKFKDIFVLSATKLKRCGSYCTIILYSHYE